jgi:hypothetical protein
MKRSPLFGLTLLILALVAAVCAANVPAKGIPGHRSSDPATAFAGGRPLVGEEAASTQARDGGYLLIYRSVEQLLAGDLLHSVSVSGVRAGLAALPDGWPVVGAGTTNWIGRNGELMPDGTTDDLHFWWADPGSPTWATSGTWRIPSLPTHSIVRSAFRFWGWRWAIRAARSPGQRGTWMTSTLGWSSG